MLTITVRIETLGLGTRAAEDICSALSYLGQVAWCSPTAFLKYDHTNHEAVCRLLDSWVGWVKAAALEEVEANFNHSGYGYGVSTLPRQKVQ